MTSKEAIELLKRLQNPQPREPHLNCAALDAVSAAISALEKQDTSDTNVGDLISRQAAIDCFWSKERYFRDALDVIKDIRRLPSAQSEQRWIPCSERLPEKDDTYIVSGVWDSGKKQVGECEFYVHDGYFRTSWNFDVKAWNPMPEPYEEERKTYETD